MKRISRIEVLMAVAQLQALRSTCTRGKVGAVIAKDYRIISTGYNGAPAGLPHCTEVGCEVGPDGGCERCSHAEAGAIAFAARTGISLEGASLYCTHLPCYDCVKLIINSGIDSVYYLKPYRDQRGLQLLTQAGILVIDLGGLDFNEQLEKFMEEYTKRKLPELQSV